MPSRGQPAKLGPFTGGLNLYSDPSSIADNELTACVNMELDLDGSLIQMPPTYEVANDDHWGIVFIGSGVVNGTSYLIASTDTDGVFCFDGVTWTEIAANLKAVVAKQYRDKFYIPATESSSSDGGYYDPLTNTWTSDSSMPRGEGALFAKARMWIVPGVNATVNKARLQFTDPIISDTLTWDSANIVDVAPGDGQNLVDLTYYNDNITLFKQDSTYVFAFDTQPSDAILRSVNPVIGTTGPYCVVNYENSVFTYHEGKVYEMVNYDFQQVNIKVPFVFDNSTDADYTLTEFMTQFGNRLVVKYHSKYYVYGLRTKTWSEWNQALPEGPMVKWPDAEDELEFDRYYSGDNYSVAGYRVRVSQDGRDGTKSFYLVEGDPAYDDIVSYIKTKDYDFGDSFHFKKLMWWGADVMAARNKNDAIAAINGTATPVSLSYKPNLTWGDLSSYTWGELIGTWGSPLSSARPVIFTSRYLTNQAARLFAKFPKTLRFRQIHFELVILGDSSLGSGPPRIYSLTAILRAKQTVPSGAN